MMKVNKNVSFFISIYSMKGRNISLKGLLLYKKKFGFYKCGLLLSLQSNCTDLGAVCMALKGDLKLTRCVCPNGMILDHVHPRCSECKSQFSKHGS